MVARSTSGRGWSLPGMAAARPGRGGGASSQVQVFTAKGLSAPGTLGTTPLLQLGTLIPGTPYVYLRPRLSQDELGGFGGSGFTPYYYPGSRRGVTDNKPGVKLSPSVHVTNPEFSFYREKRRSPSIGMAAAGSVGLTMGVPYESDVPYFSVP